MISVYTFQFGELKMNILSVFSSWNANMPLSNLCSLIVTVLASDPYRIIISHQGMESETVAMETIIWITMPLAVVPAASAGRARLARPWAGHHCTIVEVLRRLLSEC